MSTSTHLARARLAAFGRNVGVLWIAVSGLLVAAGAGADTPQSPAERFEAIWKADWQWRLEQFPRLPRGDDEGGAEPRLERLDEATQQARGDYWAELLEQLDQIDPAALSLADRANYAVFRHQIETNLDGVRMFAYQMPMNGDSSFYGSIQHWGQRQRLKDLQEAEDHLARLADVPRWLGEHQAHLAAGLAAGRTLPRIVLVGREAPLQAESELKDPTASVFYRPFDLLPETIDPTRQAELQARARKLIGEQLLPAQRSLLRFLVDSYLPGARNSIGASDLPDGAAYYQSTIREFVTLDLSPTEIHQTGLTEVERIRAEMEQIIEELQFEGSFEDFLQFLRTDRQFYARTPRELIAHASYYAKKIDGLLPDYFGKLPRAPYGVAPVPDAIAPFYTTGRYVPPPRDGGAGTYWVNTWQLDARPLYAIPALTLHEAVPGHHLQFALASEAGEQPPFRRYSYLSVYGEGWALYTEWLGQEMGVYETPYDQFGRLTYEMWRACRLVVDTGMHALGWSRQQAFDYMKSNTALSEHEIGTEIDRYIGWPGQALSYKLGEIEIRRLRADAEAQLGADFDLKAFHDQILALGSVTLPVLREAVQSWLAETVAARAADAAP
jgi:uncharacterized protein (DUF885 family)